LLGSGSQRKKTKGGQSAIAMRMRPAAARRNEDLIIKRWAGLMEWRERVGVGDRRAQG
jgi:hypothetical protein